MILTHQPAGTLGDKDQAYANDDRDDVYEAERDEVRCSTLDWSGVVVDDRADLAVSSASLPAKRP